MRRLRQLAIIAGITLVMVLIVGELGLRIVGYEDPPFYRQDARFGWTLRPNLDTRYRDEGDARIVTSSAGLRDREHATAKPPGTYRILALGDSYTEALQVDVDKAYWSRLDAELASCPHRNGRTIEVINFGVSAYGTANELLRLEDEGFSYAPDLVLVAFCLNDFQDNHPRLDHLTVKSRPYFVRNGDALVLQPGEGIGAMRGLWQGALPISRVAQLLERARKSRARRAAAANVHGAAEAGFPPELFTSDLPPDWRESWEITERLLVRMNEGVTKHGGKLLLATIPAGISVHPSDDARGRFTAQTGATDLFAAEKRLGEVAERRGFASVVLGPRMLARAKETQTCLHGFPNIPPCGGHWNETGHKVASELVAAKICAMWGDEAKAP